jgi:hypothetical protein
MEKKRQDDQRKHTALEIILFFTLPRCAGLSEKVNSARKLKFHTED